MSEPTEEEYQMTERAAAIAWRLAAGEKLTARMVATEYQMTRQGAYYLLERICRAIPVQKEKFTYERAKM